MQKVFKNKGVENLGITTPTVEKEINKCQVLVFAQNPRSFSYQYCAVFWLNFYPQNGAVSTGIHGLSSRFALFSGFLTFTRKRVGKNK